MKRTIYIAYKITDTTTTSKHDHHTSDGFFHTQKRIVNWSGPFVSSDQLLLNSEDIDSIKTIIQKCTPKEIEDHWETYTYEEPEIHVSYEDCGIANKLNDILNDKYPFVFEPTTNKLDYSFWDALNKSIIDPVKNYQSKEEKLNKEYNQSLYNLKKEYRHSLYDYYNENLSSLLSTGIIDSNCILPNLDVYPFDIACLKLNNEVVLKMIYDEYKYRKNEWVIFYVYSIFQEILPALLNNEFDETISFRYNIEETQFNALRDIFMLSMKRTSSFIRTYILKMVALKGDFELFDLFFTSHCVLRDPLTTRYYEKYDIIYQTIILHASIIHKRIDLFGLVRNEEFFDYYNTKLPCWLTKEEYFEALSIIESDDELENAFNKKLSSPYYNIRERIKYLKGMSDDEINLLFRSTFSNCHKKIVWEDL